MLPFIALFLCQLQLPPSTPPLPPSSPPPSSLIEILPGIQTLPIVGTELRERDRERERLDQNQRRSSCPPSIVSAKHSFSLVDQGTRKSNRYFPVSAFLQKKNPKNLVPVRRSVGSRRCCVCVFRDLLINLCVYVVCVGWRINVTNPSIHWQSRRISKGLLVPGCLSLRGLVVC